MSTGRKVSAFRIVAASLVSPGVIPAASAFWLAFERRDWSDFPSNFACLALMTYPVTALFMLPVFLILLRQGRASFLAITASGALVAMVVCVVVSLALVLRHPLHLRSPAYSGYTDDSLEGCLRSASWCGLFGLSIGAAFWMVAFGKVRRTAK